MKMRLLLATLVLFAATVSLVADESRPAYSRDSLLFLLRDDSVRPVDEFVKRVTTYERGGTRFTWVPLAMPLNVDGRTGGSATFSPVPSPFALLGLSFPGGVPAVEAPGLSWSEKRYRKKLVAEVSVANRAQNSDGD